MARPTQLARLRRRIRRQANKLIARRRYRVRKGGQPEPVWSIRKGPSGPSTKAQERAKRLPALHPPRRRRKASP